MLDAELRITLVCARLVGRSFTVEPLQTVSAPPCHDLLLNGATLRRRVCVTVCVDECMREALTLESDTWRVLQLDPANFNGIGPGGNLSVGL
jgi:hypothetical protein